MSGMATADTARRADARRNRDAVIDAAGALFAERGDDVQMGEIAQRAGLGVGTLYRHFADKQSLRAAIIGRRFEAMAELARSCAQAEDAGEAFESLLLGYLSEAEKDVAFRVALLSPTPAHWDDIEQQKESFSAAVSEVVDRAVTEGHLRADFTAADFILVTRGTIANMTEEGDWRRHLTLQLEGALTKDAPTKGAPTRGAPGQSPRDSGR